MRIYLHLLAAFFLFFAGSIYANTQQEKRVTGTVTSEGEPLPGVSVQLKGASSGTITDIDGNTYIDYVGSWGPMILGHAHPQVISAIQEAAENSTSYGAPTVIETELAKLVTAFYPSIEK